MRGGAKSAKVLSFLNFFMGKVRRKEGTYGNLSFSVVVENQLLTLVVVPVCSTHNFLLQ